MSLVYGLEPAGDNRIEWRPMRTNKTYYAGQIMVINTLGSVYTAATTATGIYGVLASDKTTTATEKTTKVPVYVFNPGGLFIVKADSSASDHHVGSLCDFALNTTSRYRLRLHAANQKNFQVISVSRFDTATTAGRRILVSVQSSKSTYIGVGKHAE